MARATRAAPACALALLLAPCSQGAHLPQEWKPSWVFVLAGAGHRLASAASGAPGEDFVQLRYQHRF